MNVFQRCLLVVVATLATTWLWSLTVQRGHVYSAGMVVYLFGGVLLVGMVLEFGVRRPKRSAIRHAVAGAIIGYAAGLVAYLLQEATVRPAAVVNSFQHWPFAGLVVSLAIPLWYWAWLAGALCALVILLVDRWVSRSGSP